MMSASNINNRIPSGYINIEKTEQISHCENRNEKNPKVFI